MSEDWLGENTTTREWRCCTDRVWWLVFGSFFMVFVWSLIKSIYWRGKSCSFWCSRHWHYRWEACIRAWPSKTPHRYSLIRGLVKKFHLFFTQILVGAANAMAFAFIIFNPSKMLIFLIGIYNIIFEYFIWLITYIVWCLRK